MPDEIVIGQNVYAVVGGDCSCCGCADNDDDMIVYRACLVDNDGTYYPRLCDMCLESIHDEVQKRSAQHPASDRQNKIDALVELMPEECDDGVVNAAEDMGDLDWSAHDGGDE